MFNHEMSISVFCGTLHVYIGYYDDVMFNVTEVIDHVTEVIDHVTVFGGHVVCVCCFPTFPGSRRFLPGDRPSLLM